MGELGDPGCRGRTSSCRTGPASRFETPRISSALSGRGRRSCGGTFDLEAKGKRIKELERLAADPTFWEDQDRARTLLQEKSELEREVRFFDETRASIEEAEVLLDLSREEEDAETGREAAERVEALARSMGMEDTAGSRLATSMFQEAVRGIGDGVVSIESARLPGVDDTVVVEANHLSMIVNLLRSDSTPPAIPIVLERLARRGETGAEGRRD